jgi:hypothetical protein
LTIHIRHHLDHFHSLATSCLQLLPMNIISLCSSPTNIMLSIINKSCSFGLSIRVATNCPLKLVSRCSRNPGQTFILWWHTFCILAHYFSMPNIPL